MARDHGAEAQTPRRLGVKRVEANKIAVIDKLAAGLTASVEARLALRSLTMKCKQTKPFDRPDRRGLAVRQRPHLQDRFTDAQEFVGYFPRGPDESGVRQRHNSVEPRGDIVQALGGSLRHQPRPFARSKSDESEKFSCTPTLRGERPSAMPSNWVK